MTTDAPRQRVSGDQPTQRMEPSVRVRVLKAGRVAHPSLIREPQRDVQVGDELDVDELWASTLIAAGRAELVE